MGKNSIWLGGLAVVVLILIAAALNTDGPQNNSAEEINSPTIQKTTGVLPVPKSNPGTSVKNESRPLSLGGETDVKKTTPRNETPEINETAEKKTNESIISANSYSGTSSAFSAPAAAEKSVGQKASANTGTEQITGIITDVLSAVEGRTPLGIDCGGRTEPKEGLGPVFGTLTCRICNLACFPKAYLWDSVTKTCGCAG